jgi:hypothetical protein
MKFMSVLFFCFRYRTAAREVLVPKVGYGLASELRRAGVYVRMVSDKSQAADEALKLHMHRSIRTGTDCICLVSDDSDFANILKLAQSKDLHTVVVGDTSSLNSQMINSHGGRLPPGQLSLEPTRYTDSGPSRMASISKQACTKTILTMPMNCEEFGLETVEPPDLQTVMPVTRIWRI